jgi:hypothetical protein
MLAICAATLCDNIVDLPVPNFETPIQQDKPSEML